MDLGINYFSHHLPLCAIFKLNDSVIKPSKDGSPVDSANVRVHKRLRWGKGDRPSYYSYTSALESMICVIDSLRGAVNRDALIRDGKCQSFVDQIYDYVVTVLNKAAQLFVPQKRRNFYKFWWGRNLKLPKQHLSNLRTWKAAGKPRQGPIFEKRKRCRSVYRQLLRDEEKREKII